MSERAAWGVEGGGGNKGACVYVRVWGVQRVGRRGRGGISGGGKASGRLCVTEDAANGAMWTRAARRLIFPWWGGAVVMGGNGSVRNG